MHIAMYVGTTKLEPVTLEDMVWTGRTGPDGRTVPEQVNPETGDREPVPIPVLREKYGFHSVVVYKSKHQVTIISLSPVFQYFTVPSKQALYLL